jgi:hypothetical protein
MALPKINENIFFHRGRKFPSNRQFLRHHVNAFSPKIPLSQFVSILSRPYGEDRDWGDNGMERTNIESVSLAQSR